MGFYQNRINIPKGLVSFLTMQCAIVAYSKNMDGQKQITLQIKLK